MTDTPDSLPAASPCPRTDRHESHVHEVYRRPFLCPGRTEPAEAQQAEAASDLQTLAAALDGLGTLLATSARDWGTYRVDAWLWALLCGWDCEETTHTESCVHGAMEEMAAEHGWDEAAVAKARRYRAAIRRLTGETPGGGR
ncbi:hypothetical protein AB0904_27840 [Streptomyces sp. NPDC006684]|uniref:hypothetical protein n=1 Tax=Streptomyces sp. NPDC006684 TaxID=3154477 RepID=UPI0034572C33